VPAESPAATLWTSKPGQTPNRGGLTLKQAVGKAHLSPQSWSQHEIRHPARDRIQKSGSIKRGTLQVRRSMCITGNIARRRASKARASSAPKLALASVGEGPEDGAGVLVHDLTKVHGDGEQEDQEKKVDAKE
jgi:hypothetical protein